MKKLILLVTLCFVFTLNGYAQTGSCTPSATVHEGDLEPNGIAAFGVLPARDSVIIDHVNAGSGLQSITIVSSNGNQVVTIPEFKPGTYEAVTVTFERFNPDEQVKFILRAASLHSAIYISVRCA